MQYVWRFRLWPEWRMTASDGRSVAVIDPGTQNRGSGPDFFNAKVTVDGQMWAGNVEVHVRASDWHRHGHDDDPAYDNVVLHVVQYDDCAVNRRTDGAVIPQVTMRCAADFSDRYNAMVNDPTTELPCAREMASLPAVVVTDMVTAMGFERLSQKAERVAGYVELFNGDWNRAIYVALARGLGFGTNADAMEQLARSVPLKMLLRNSDSLLSIEAMLFGHAGMLQSPARDQYEEALLTEYRFYCTKYGISTPTAPQWRSRLRPQNAPVRRIALLAALVHGGFELAARILEPGNVADAAQWHLFDAEASNYWLTHSSFGHPTANMPLTLSASSQRLLLINVVAPLLYAYGRTIGDDDRCELAVDLLQSLRAEDNAVVAIFTRAGMRCTDAFTSQAYLQLRNQYCLTRKCLYCRIGHRLLASKVRATS